MPALSVVDALDAGQRAAVVALLDAVETESGHPALPDAKLAEVRGSTAATGFAVLAHDADRLVGYAHALRLDDETTWYVQSVVAPPGTLETAGLLAAAAVAEAWARRAGTVRLWVFRADAEADAWAGSLGASPVREVIQMRRPLPHPDAPAFPAGTTLRTFVPGHDEDAWLGVNGAAFAAHPEQHTFSRSDLDARMAAPWFDPADFLVLDDDLGMAGFCWVKSIGPRPGAEAGHGEIYVIAADPRRQGEGLGRTLTLAGLARMAENGLAEARLYVDGGNAPALALYESLGFRRHHADRVYEVAR